MPKIEEMYAFVIEDTGPDDEGVVGMGTKMGWMPLVGADMARVESLKPLASVAARASGKKVKLLHFGCRRLVEVIEPGVDPC